MALQQLTREDFIVLNLAEMQGPRNDIYTYTGADPNDLDPALPGNINQGDLVLIATETEPNFAGEAYQWNGSNLDLTGEFISYPETPSGGFSGLPDGRLVAVYDGSYQGNIAALAYIENGNLGPNLFNNYNGILVYDQGWSYSNEFPRVVFTEEQQTQDLAPNSTGSRTLKISVADEYYPANSQLVFLPDFSTEKAFPASQATHEFKFKCLEDSNFQVYPELYVVTDLNNPADAKLLFVEFSLFNQDPSKRAWTVQGFFLNSGSIIGGIEQNIESNIMKMNEWNHVKVSLVEHEDNVFLVGEVYDYDSQEWVREVELNLSQDMPNGIGEALANSLISSDHGYGFGFVPNVFQRGIEGTLLDDYRVTEVNLSTGWSE